MIDLNNFDNRNAIFKHDDLRNFQKLNIVKTWLSVSKFVNMHNLADVFYNILQI